MSQFSHRHIVAAILSVGNAGAAAFAAAGLLFVAGTAAASTTSSLPDAMYEVSVGGTTNDYSAPGDYAAGGGHVTTSNSPSASATTTVSGDGSARGYIRYSWQLNGPAGVVVPVIVTGHLDVSSAAPSDGQANAVASLLWNSGLFTDSVSLEIDRGGYNNSGPTHADPTFREMVTTGSGGLIILDTFVNVGKGSGRAYADPVFSIDPTFAAVDADYLSHYSFTFSSGIGNSPGAISAVPESSTWALMVAGLSMAGLVGARARRKDQSPR